MSEASTGNCINTNECRQAKHVHILLTSSNQEEYILGFVEEFED